MSLEKEVGKSYFQVFAFKIETFQFRGLSNYPFVVKFFWASDIPKIPKDISVSKVLKNAYLICIFRRYFMIRLNSVNFEIISPDESNLSHKWRKSGLKIIQNDTDIANKY